MSQHVVGEPTSKGALGWVVAMAVAVVAYVGLASLLVAALLMLELPGWAVNGAAGMLGLLSLALGWVIAAAMRGNEPKT